MKIELRPTDENILKTIQEDILGRNKKIISFLKLLFSIKDNTSICLDGDWGAGKTFFIKQCIKTITFINGEDFDLGKFKSDIETNFVNMENKILPIYYNAWEWDSEEDPLITIMYDIIKENNIDVDTFERKGLGEKLKEFMNGIQLQGSVFFQNSVEAGIAVQLPKVEKKDLLEKIKFSVNIKEKFKDVLNEFIKEKAEKIVIFIDELDRCNPKFAVKLIERVKNFLDDDRFIFVFSTNINELQNIITNAYGINFNGAYYLQKFFDLQVSLPPIDISAYIKYYNIISNGWLPDVVAEDILEYLNYNIRDCNRFLTTINYIYDYIMNSKPALNEFTYMFVRDIVFVMLLCIKFKKYNDYQKIILGRGVNEFSDYIIRSAHAIEYIDGLIGTSGRKREEVIKGIYEGLFVKKGNETYDIGRLNINRYVRNDLNELLGFINENIKLE